MGHAIQEQPHRARFRFSEKTLLESGSLPLERIAEMSLREGNSSQPIYRVHRWFARRLSTQFRSILTALNLSESENAAFWGMYYGEIDLGGAVVLDPFVGGGTSVVEASRCNARVIGFDIDPVATKITRFELSAASMTFPETAICKLKSAVRETISPFHKTVLGSGETATVIHHFWVETLECSNCNITYQLHPHYQLAYDKKGKTQWVFCKRCFGVRELAIDRKRFRCDCSQNVDIKKGNISQGVARCPNCRHKQKLSGHRIDKPPQWHLFAQEYLHPETNERCFKKASEQDREIFDKAAAELEKLEQANGTFRPLRPIPLEGRSSQRPLVHGIKTYSNLFNARQLLHLHELGRCIRQVDDADVREILNLAYSEHLATNNMYVGFAFGYRRTSQLFAIHGFRHVTRPVEINPWLDGIGRGTYPNVLRKFERALSFAANPTGPKPRAEQHERLIYGNQKSIGPKSGKISRCAREVVQGDSEAAIITQSSENLACLDDECVDLILTDPPYFNNVSYSELSDFYLAWHQVVGFAEPPYDDLVTGAPIKQNLAVTESGSEAVECYKVSLARIFAECCRVLKTEGLMVFTYHHLDANAWLALAEALHNSGLSCTSVIPMRGEGQGGLHSKAQTIKWDAVFTCRKAPFPKQRKLMIALNAIREIKARVEGYCESFPNNLGFAAVDQVNLTRALSLKYMTTEPTEESVELKSYLSTPGDISNA